MIFALAKVATDVAIEYFISGAMAAISLFCGTKTPRNKRK